MSYLYGDSTPSPLTSNFLEFLRSALDFSVHVLLSDERIRNEEQRLAEIERSANVSRDEVHALAEITKQATAGFRAQTKDARAEHCASVIVSRVDDSVSAELANIQSWLDGEWRTHRAWVAEERAGCNAALGTMLTKCEPPDTNYRIEFNSEAGKPYTFQAWGKSKLGFAWTQTLEAPKGNVFGGPARVERFVDTLEIPLPTLVAGFFKKEFKVKPADLTKFVVLGMPTTEEGLVRLQVRADATSPEAKPAGYEFEFGSDGEVTAFWTGELETQPHALSEEDSAKLWELKKNIGAALHELLAHGKELIEATFDNASFATSENQVSAVTRLIEAMAPATREIANHSLTPNELVLRRLLGNDRREEIFVTKASLREKLSPLSAELAALFDGLELGAVATRTSAPEVKTHIEAAPAAATPDVATAPVALSEAPQSDRPVDRPSSTSVNPNSLATTLKQIVSLAKSGKTDQAYSEYADFFASDRFLTARPEDQRQALKIMVFSKTTTTNSPAVQRAYQAARDAIDTLARQFDEPADYEMLGVCQMVLEQKEAASATFATALAIERERSPESALVTALEKRVASVS